MPGLEYRLFLEVLNGKCIKQFRRTLYYTQANTTRGKIQTLWHNSNKMHKTLQDVTDHVSSWLHAEKQNENPKHIQSISRFGNCQASIIADNRGKDWWAMMQISANSSKLIAGTNVPEADTMWSAVQQQFKVMTHKNLGLSFIAFPYSVEWHKALCRRVQTLSHAVGKMRIAAVGPCKIFLKNLERKWAWVITKQLLSADVSHCGVYYTHSVMQFTLHQSLPCLLSCLSPTG